MKGKLFMFGFLSLILESLFVNASIFDSNQYNVPISLGFLDDPNLWVIIASAGVLGLIFYLLSTRVPLFRDNNTASIIFSILLSIIALIVTPVLQIIVWAVGISAYLLIPLFFILFILLGLSKFHQGGTEVVSTIGESHQKMKDKINSGQRKKIFRRFKGYLDDAEKLLDEDPDRVKEILDSVSDQLRIRASGNRNAEAEIDPVRVMIDQAKDAVEANEIDQAKKFIKKAKNRLKKFRKD